MPKLQTVTLSVNSKSIKWAMRAAAKKIGDKIGEAYELAITNFYHSYDQKRYTRTHSLYKGAMGVGGRKVFFNNTGRYSYDCGIEVGPEYYEGNPYVKSPPHGLYVTPEWVFPRAFDKGIHGFTSYEAKPFKNNAYASILPGGYWWKTVPTKSTPPKVLLNKDFRIINNENFIQNIIEGELNPSDPIEIK